MAHIHTMQVLLDGESLRIDRPTLAAAMKSASDAARVRGRIIIEMKADGQRIPDELLARASEELTTVKVLSFASAEPRGLVSQSLALRKKELHLEPFYNQVKKYS
jgi:hypothetical protein